MKLTQEAQQSIDFAKSCYLKGLCTAREYMKAVETIHNDDVAKQAAFLMKQGFTRHGAIEDIYNIRQEEIL